MEFIGVGNNNNNYNHRKTRAYVRVIWQPGRIGVAPFIGRFDLYDPNLMKFSERYFVRSDVWPTVHVKCTKSNVALTHCFVFESAPENNNGKTSKIISNGILKRSVLPCGAATLGFRCTAAATAAAARIRHFCELYPSVCNL